MIKATLFEIIYEILIKEFSKFQYPVFLVRWKPVVANRQYHLLQGFMLYFEQHKLSITFPGMEVRLTGL